MKKIITIGVTLAAALSLAACGSSTTDSSKSSDPKSSQSSKADSNKVTKSGYDAIKLGDLTKNGTGGDTLDALTSKFGKPASTTSGESNGVKTDIDTWTNVDGNAGAAMVLTFVNKNVVGKNITKLAVTLKKTIALADYNALATGTKYEDVNKQFGDPDSLNETLIGGQKTIIAIYTNKDASNMTATFVNDALTTKTQTNLK